MKKIHWVELLPYYLLVAILCIGGAYVSSGAVTAAVQREPVVREHTFIIDAGHGGIDGGATSCTGVLESKLNLEIAMRLNDLMQLLGYDTRMIRTTDISIYTEGNTIAAQKVSDLKERVRICNSTENAVLVSIHQNTFSDGRYYGAQVFYADTPGSKELANSIQNALFSDRGAKKAGTIYLLQNIKCTGVLVECGFLSNPAEEAKLRIPEYQQYLCGVIVATISANIR